MNTIIIVGASHAGVAVASNLRQKGCEDEIILISDESSLPYQRPPLSKDYYKDKMPEEKLLQKNETFYETSNIDLKLNCKVTAIDRKNKNITLESGEKIVYTKLVLATGTRARPLKELEHHNVDNVHYLRTKEDVDALKIIHQKSRKLLIIGAGYIGLEIASAAVKNDMDVIILEFSPRVLARVTSPIVSEFYSQLHAENGVDIRVNIHATAFVFDGENSTALLSDGSKVSFDCAIIGVGVLPNSELAEVADLACDNGILVDEYMRTKDPDIYAVGDCSNHYSFLYERRIRLESVPNAIEQARIAAANICGEEEKQDSIPWFWSDQYGLKLQTAGLSGGYDQTVVRGDIDSKKFSVFYLKQDLLIAMDALNSAPDFISSKKLIFEKVSPDPKLLADPNFNLKLLLSPSHPS